MKINYYKQPEIKALQKQLSSLEDDDTVHGILLLACDANNYSPEKLDIILTSFTKPIFGGVFPGIIFNDHRYETGFIVMACDWSPSLSLIENLSSSETDFDGELIKLAKKYSDTNTMFIFIDGFAERVGAFIESIFSIFGLENNYIGGGAGSLSLKQKPCIITNEGLKQDCAIICGTTIKSGIGVKHGWETIAGPYKVTSADKTIINELDNKPAFEVYKEAVDKYTGQSIGQDNFFDIAKGCPFGIEKIDAEKVVRDPLFLGENSSLICVGEVETGSFVNILSGNKESLIQAAGQAVTMAMQSMEGDPEHFIFFIDCISRVLFLENDFEQEIATVYSKSKNLPVFGALTIGEIANNGKDYLEFYNKTSVIGCF
ncbi:MAG: FIST C-terminal domain-containing protein [candidate division Zixibacteria bacterium]|nr:FIST C-terminal domain-containing protein [candidate division Zixibacteria bacterium]